MSALEPTTKSDKAKQETKYVQLGESERRRLAAPATVEATKRRAKASVVSVLRTFFGFAWPTYPDEGVGTDRPYGGSFSLLRATVLMRQRHSCR